MRGKAYVALKLQIEYQDHPRLCGEKCDKGIGLGYVKGSPPPMRGKAKKYRAKGKKSGITPAYAGKSSGTHSVCQVCQDHPRLCGEKRKVIAASRHG